MSDDYDDDYKEQTLIYKQEREAEKAAFQAWIDAGSIVVRPKLRIVE